METLDCELRNALKKFQQKIVDLTTSSTPQHMRRTIVTEFVGGRSLLYYGRNHLLCLRGNGWRTSRLQSPCFPTTGRSFCHTGGWEKFLPGVLRFHPSDFSISSYSFSSSCTSKCIYKFPKNSMKANSANFDLEKKIGSCLPFN